MDTDSRQTRPLDTQPSTGGATGIRTVWATTDAQYRRVQDLFCAYAASLDFDLGFQGFAAEVAALPGDYGPPRGAILIAEVGSEAAGCVALRDLGGGGCEMKRLYVSPEFRGCGIGRILAAAIIGKALALGYRAMRLDTVATMAHAEALYRSLGFAPIAPYRYNPIPGAAFYELNLAGPGA